MNLVNKPDPSADWIRRIYDVPNVSNAFADRLKMKTLAAVHKHSVQRQRHSAWFRRGITLLMATSAVTAAVLIVHISVGPSRVFALQDVVNSIRWVERVSFTEVTTIGDEDPQRCRVTLIAPHLRRNQYSDGSVALIDVHRGKMLKLSSPAYSAARFVDFPPRRNDNVVESLFTLVGLPDAIGAIPVTQAKPLDDKMIGGRMAIGFELTLDHQEYQSTVKCVVWADKYSRRPIEINSTWTPTHSDKTMTVTMSDFDYGPVDGDKIELSVPDGFTLQNPPTSIDP